MGAGRPFGSVTPKLFKDALTLAVKRSDGDKSTLAAIANALVAKAVGGDVQAIREVADRLDGKPTQIVAGDENAPLEIIQRIERVIVGKNAKD